MSINVLNSNQILTLKQLESGKTYTFVGTTGNYSDYMCVTAGMFEAPAVPVTSYRLEVKLQIPEYTSIALSMDGNPQDYGIDAYLCAYDYTSNGYYYQQRWAENFSNTTNVFSLGPSAQLSFMKMFHTNEGRLGSGLVESYSEWRRDGGSISLDTAYMGSTDSTLIDNTKNVTKSSSAETITLDYDLYLREAYNIDTYQGFMFWIFQDSDGSYINQQVRYIYSVKFNNFKDTNPRVYNGIGYSVNIISDTTIQDGSTLIRRVTIEPDGEIGFLYY